MKTKKILFFIIIVIIIIALFISKAFKGNKPFDKLSFSDISKVSVELFPPNKTYNLNEDEITEFVSLLKTVVVYNKDNSYQDYCGQTVIFNITKKDGATLSVTPFGKFMIIDGIGYRTKESPSYNLHKFANKISAGE